MLEYFSSNNNGFLTRKHKRISGEELWALEQKLTARNTPPLTRKDESITVNQIDRKRERQWFLK
jgi:hypothetical protein